MTDLPVPLVPEMIHRPGEPSHMMRVKSAGRRVAVRFRGREIAASDRALRVMEIARDVYDPVLYLPLDDVSAPLAKTGRSTHCPLKGDTTYYDLADDPEGTEIGWSYTRPLPIATVLEGYIAFDPARVSVEEGPLPS